MKQFLTVCTLLCFIHVQSQDFNVSDKFRDASIIGVGETGHGYESINQLKSEFVEYLQSEQNFQAIAFESSFTQSIMTYLNSDVIETRARKFLYPFWNTPSVVAVLKPFTEKEKQLSIPLIIGFDMQEDCRFTSFSEFLINNKLIITHVNALKDCDSILSFYIGETYRVKQLSEVEYIKLIDNYSKILEELTTKDINANHRRLLKRCLENRQWLCKYLRMARTSERMFFRDSLMTENIIWLKNGIYNDHKLILWGANTHISKSEYNFKARWAGEWLSAKLKNQYTAVGIEKGKGKYNFTSKDASFQFNVPQNNKFDIILYVTRSQKIKQQEWITRCK